MYLIGGSVALFIFLPQKPSAEPSPIPLPLPEAEGEPARPVCLYPEVELSVGFLPFVHVYDTGEERLKV